MIQDDTMLACAHRGKVQVESVGLVAFQHFHPNPFWRLWKTYKSNYFFGLLSSFFSFA